MPTYLVKRIKRGVELAFLAAIISAPMPAQKNGAVSKRAVHIKGSTFEMGIADAAVPELMQKFSIKRPELFQESGPVHTVTLSDFYLDKTEVTNDMFKRFLDKDPEWKKGKISPDSHNGKYLDKWEGAKFPDDEGNFPVVNVTWQAAAAYCRSVEMRLPTEAEWEYSARGGKKNALFPWGDEVPDKSRLNYGKSGFGRAVPVGRYPPNGFGLYDMAGNVWEFLADEWQPYKAGAAKNPVAGNDLFVAGESFRAVTTRRALRGGSYGAGDLNLLVTYRDSHLPSNAADHVGFRCAASFKKK